MTFKVGDRVKVYGTCNRHKGNSQGFYDGETGEVKECIYSWLIHIEVREHGREPPRSMISAHPKQCRRLVRKTK